LWLDPAAAALWLERLPLSEIHPNWPMNCAGGACSNAELSLIAPGAGCHQVEEGPGPLVAPAQYLAKTTASPRRFGPQLPQVAWLPLRGSNLLDRVQPGRRQRQPHPGLLATGPGRLRGGDDLSACGSPAAQRLQPRKPTASIPCLDAWQQGPGSARASAAWAKKRFERSSAPHPPLARSGGRAGSPRPACLELDTPQEGR